jgi:DNA polymerase III gamma/tau subunit
MLIGVESQLPTPTSMPFHTKYRPSNLDEIIGHSKAVSTLRGYIKRGLPSAILLTGPTSSGKTTLARALATSVLGSSIEGNQNWLEMNLSDSRSIDDVRGIIRESRIRPLNGASHRFVLLDEAQGILSNAPAANALLKPLEEPVASTTFILSSMDGEKFRSSQLGKSISNRCVRINLEPHSEAELLEQANRILEGEKAISLFTPDVLNSVVESSNQSMRELANLSEKKKRLTAEDLPAITGADAHPDDDLAVDFLAAVYSGSFAKAQLQLLDIKEPVTFINRCTWVSWFLLNSMVHKGGRHPKLWPNKHTQRAQKIINEAWENENLKTGGRLRRLALVNSALVGLRLQSGAFAVDEAMALSRFAYLTIEEMNT